MKPVSLKGLLGKAISRSIKDRFLTLDYALLEEPFRLRNETDNAWRCEFWGKIVRSAITAAVIAAERRSETAIDLIVGRILPAAASQRSRIAVDPLGTVRRHSSENTVIQ